MSGVSDRGGQLQRERDGGWWARTPVYCANFLFQRILGINRDCPWSVHFTSKVQSPERIHLGSGVRESFAFSGGCYIQAQNGLSFDEGSSFGWGVKIITSNHDPEDFTRFVPTEPVRIGRHCRIGENAIVLAGVTLGDHVTVLPGSVVTRSFPASTVIGGVPAEVHLPEGERSAPVTSVVAKGIE